MRHGEEQDGETHIINHRPGIEKAGGERVDVSLDGNVVDNAAELPWVVFGQSLEKDPAKEVEDDEGEPDDRGDDLVFCQSGRKGAQCQMKQAGEQQDQIAAGEVVQRPESVVKELVENAIDAEASSIAVIVQQAGKTLIHVIDNGKGMSTDDLPMALKRHATSKISTVADLHKIITLGFRGEALASIAAVANVEIRTKRNEDSIGYRLLSEPLKNEVIEPFQCDKGTQIIVKNLFYNVPARKKFLRSDLTEFRHISETMVKFALAYPNIRFTFSDNKTIIFDVKQQTLRIEYDQ